MSNATETALEDEGRAPPSRLFGETRDSIGSVWRNRNLRRIQLAFAGSAIGDWAYGTAVAVWAYGVGGPAAVGIFTAVRLGLMAVSSPFGAILADRMDRQRLMITCDAVRGVVVTVAAVCLFLDTSPWPVFVLAALTAVLGSPFRVAQRALLPRLAATPTELTASNATSSTIESLSFFAGPAIAALLLGVTSVPVVFLLDTATFVWSMVLVLGLVVPPREEDPAPRATEEEQSGPGFLSETLAGFATIGKDRGLAWVVGAVSAQTVVAGASSVFVVVMADDVLGTGARGMGYLDSMLGVGAIVGGVLAISRASRNRLSRDMATGVVLWSLPLLLVTAWPHPVTCFLAMGLLGLGNPLVDTNMDTIVQRITPDEVLGRVFGALEACLIGTMALGALIAPPLLDALGLRWMMLAIGLPVAGVVVLGLPIALRLDQRLREPAALALLRTVDLFSPLSPAVLESLAGAARPATYAAGTPLVRQGEESDVFFVIESGRVEVTQDGRVLRQEGPGEYFGEIGLLRDVPRTATVTAVEDTVVQTLAREDFLRAVTGHRDSTLAAERVVSRRLGM